MGLRFTLTYPIPNPNWWDSSKGDIEQIVREFHEEKWAAQQDPVTGAGWAARKQGGGWPILRKTGAMMGSTTIKATGVMQFVA
ncbi:MAG: hypothetical protein EB168_12080, partial [Euryarchaeota archaeon]|nr:hypothetical protein [Euryarchaeota archaeon]